MSNKRRRKLTKQEEEEEEEDDEINSDSDDGVSESNEVDMETIASSQRTDDGQQQQSFIPLTYDPIPENTLSEAPGFPTAPTPSALKRYPQHCDILNKPLRSSKQRILIMLPARITLKPGAVNASHASRHDNKDDSSVDVILPEGIEKKMPESVDHLGQIGQIFHLNSNKPVLIMDLGSRGKLKFNGTLQKSADRTYLPLQYSERISSYKANPIQCKGAFDTILVFNDYSWTEAGSEGDITSIVSTASLTLSETSLPKKSVASPAPKRRKSEKAEETPTKSSEASFRVKDEERTPVKTPESKRTGRIQPKRQSRTQVRYNVSSEEDEIEEISSDDD